MIRLAIAIAIGSVAIAAFVLFASVDPRSSVTGLAFFAVAGLGTGFLAARRGALAGLLAALLGLLWPVLFPRLCAPEGCEIALIGYPMLVSSFLPVVVLVVASSVLGTWVRGRIVRR